MLVFLAKIIVTGLALWMADISLEGMAFDNVGTLIVAAIALGLANALVRPIVAFLTYPITLLTFRISLLVINGAMVLAVAILLPGFRLDGLGPAVAASIFVSLLNWFVQGREHKKR